MHLTNIIFLIQTQFISLNNGMNSSKGREMNKLHNISNVHFENDHLVLNIDGKVKNYPINRISRKLQTASDAERDTYEISASGYGIHWPLIDEDLSIDGLLKSPSTSEFSSQMNEAE
jgi:hypothetical protein